MGSTGSNGYELPVDFIISFGSKLVMSGVVIGESSQGSESCCEKGQLPSITE